MENKKMTETVQLTKGASQFIGTEFAKLWLFRTNFQVRAGLVKLLGGDLAPSSQMLRYQSYLILTLKSDLDVQQAILSLCQMPQSY